MAALLETNWLRRCLCLCLVVHFLQWGASLLIGEVEVTAEQLLHYPTLGTLPAALSCSLRGRARKTPLSLCDVMPCHHQALSHSGSCLQSRDRR